MAKHCGVCWHYNDLFFEPPICDRHELTWFFDETKKAKDCPSFNERYKLDEEDWED